MVSMSFPTVLCIVGTLPLILPRLQGPISPVAFSNPPIFYFEFPKSDLHKLYTLVHYTCIYTITGFVLSLGVD